MLRGIHFLLTYTCNFECDHCFLYCSPQSRGAFTLERVRYLLAQARKLGTVESVFFEGGEPLLYFPLLEHSIKAAKEFGFSTGVVTNAYLSTSTEDAKLWLKPLMEAGLDRLSLSEDEFHGSGEDGPAGFARAAARQLGQDSGVICINSPKRESPGEGQEKGAAVVGGGAMFRGRAAEELTRGLPRRSWEELTECPHEKLAEPGRVHADPFGNLHLCQGLIMGNVWKASLAEVVQGYNSEEHPICGPLLRGGPAQLVREYGLEHEEGYVDECHLCFMARKALRDRFPGLLAPAQVYGLEA